MGGGGGGGRGGGRGVAETLVQDTRKFHVKLLSPIVGRLQFLVISTFFQYKIPCNKRNPTNEAATLGEMCGGCLTGIPQELA